MKTILLFLFCFFNSNSQNSANACDVNFLVSVEENIDGLSDDEIEIFLKTFANECKTNVEFSQYYNELLFKIAEKHTQVLINCFEKISFEKKLLILSEFENSVIEIDTQALIKKLKNATGNQNSKSDLIKAISINN